MAAPLKVVSKTPGKFVPVDVDSDDDDDDDAPKPAPAGAPAWLATFADIATNLMAFFVLILGFARFDEPSFQKMAGSMRETFGTTVVPTIAPNPANGTVLELDFIPQGSSSEPAPGEEAPRGAPGEGEVGNGPVNDTTGVPPSPSREAAREAAQALMQALEEGNLEIEQGQKHVTLRLPDTEEAPTAEQVAAALANLGNAEQPVEDATTKTDPPDEQAEAGTGEAAPGQGGEGGPEAGRGTSPGFAEAKLSVALRDQKAQGLVDVERRDGAVFVTLGAGGAFDSGSAELTPEALAIIETLSDQALGPNVRVTVTGHTDNVPLAGSPFVDNFGLGAARASAVVHALVEEGVIAPDQITAVSKGETMPVADNTTEEGRAKNRRVVIEVDYEGESTAD